MKGDKPIVTSLVGASAAPRPAPAARPEMTPSQWSDVRRRPAALAGAGMGLPERDEKPRAEREDDNRHPELDVGENG